ncbi:ERV/ALR sulfhydryl oxidase domain-containing protein [Gautieria morchelliformis]|nr:ERV/ALR sulfhydryl oxidase domain-containing protein [Gautieria morchelliformis]
MQVSRFSKSFLILVVVLVSFSSLFILRRPILAYKDPWSGHFFGEGGVEIHDEVTAKVPYQGVDGGVIMGKLGNETAKAALGRATWKLLHTMTLRYPDVNPTEDQRLALATYFQLSARLYPCGECAAEFQLLLKKYPPQTSSRKAASLWLCYLHNQVNERLQKPLFDCANLDGTYDCGCGDNPLDTKAKSRTDEETGIDLIQGG